MTTNVSAPVDASAGASRLLERIGRTPLIELPRFARGAARVLAKLEQFNPGGSVKDRIAKAMVEDAEARGALGPGGTIVEATSGNTGVALAMVAAVKGYRCVIVMPEGYGHVKARLMQALGTEVVRTPADAMMTGAVDHAREIAAATPGAYVPDQFHNPVNPRTHFETTGPEIWRDTSGRVDAFVCATGTGGTLAGVARYLKEQKSSVRIVLADPMGSALYNYVKTGELKLEGSSITEGIGSSRVTANLKDTPIDDAVRVPDTECVPMVYRLLRRDGLFVGGSTGINVAAAVRVAREMGPGHTIVTLLCDRGSLYLGRLFNAQFLASKGLPTE